MLGYGRARDDRGGSPPHRASGRSDTGRHRDPSPAAVRRGAGHGHAPRGLSRLPLIAGRWQEHRRARVDTSPAPRPPDVLESRPVFREPREGYDPGHPRASGHDVHRKGHVVPHGERDMTEPMSTPDPVDDGSPGSVEPPPVAIWDGLPDLCSGPESLPWCGECFTDRRRAQACPWGALTRVVVESARDRPKDWGDRPSHDGTALG